MSKEKQIDEMASILLRLDDCEKYDEIKCIGDCKKCRAMQIYTAGYRKQEWISVEERLPDVLDSYIVVVKQKYEWETEWEYDTDVASFVFCDGYIDGVWNTYNDWKEGQECHITHWMPIPKPPKMKGGAE